MLIWVRVRITAGLVEESAMSGRTRSELLSDVNQDTRPYKRQPHNSFEAYFSSDAAALVEHTRRCAACWHLSCAHICASVGSRSSA